MWLTFGFTSWSFLGSLLVVQRARKTPFLGHSTIRDYGVSQDHCTNQIATSSVIVICSCQGAEVNTLRRCRDDPSWSLSNNIRWMLGSELPQLRDTRVVLRIPDPYMSSAPGYTASEEKSILALRPSASPSSWLTADRSAKKVRGRPPSRS